MREPGSARVALAVVRAVVANGARPVIQVLRMDELFNDEQVVGTTTSPDEAARLIRDWLSEVVPRLESDTRANGGRAP